MPKSAAVRTAPPEIAYSPPRSKIPPTSAKPMAQTVARWSASVGCRTQCPVGGKSGKRLPLMTGRCDAAGEDALHGSAGGRTPCSRSFLLTTSTSPFRYSRAAVAASALSGGSSARSRHPNPDASGRTRAYMPSAASSSAIRATSSTEPPQPTLVSICAQRLRSAKTTAATGITAPAAPTARGQPRAVTVATPSAATTRHAPSSADQPTTFNLAVRSHARRRPRRRHPDGSRYSAERPDWTMVQSVTDGTAARIGDI